MNSLSWFVYLIQVVSTLSSIASVTMFLSVLIYGGLWLVRSIAYSEVYGDRSREEYDTVKRPMIVFYQRLILGVFCVSLFLNIFVPKKETMILIAASEVGEKVFASQSVKNILDPSIELLQEYIKKELDELKSTPKKSK